MVIIFDWGALLTQGQLVQTAFCIIISRTPHFTIFAPIYDKYGQVCEIGIWHTYLGEPNMVDRGIPEKNHAVQTH